MPSDHVGLSPSELLYPVPLLRGTGDGYAELVGCTEKRPSH